MLPDESPTKWLAEMGTDPRAKDKLAEYLLARSRRLAEAFFGRRTRAGVGPSDIAVSAVASLVRDLHGGGLSTPSSLSLFALLAYRIRLKSATAVRRSHAQKRNITREERGSAEFVPDTADSPIDVAIADELADRVMELVEEDPDELQQLVTYLGIVEGKTAAEIVAAIEAAKQSEDEHVPSISAIYVWLRAARHRIEESLREEGFLDAE